MTRVGIVYHGGYGHTGRLAQAVARGASSVPGTQVALVPVEEVAQSWEVLDESDAIVFGSPTYMGGPSAAFKAFADSTSKRCFDQRWKDKLAAGFTNSGGPSGDKLATLQQLAILAAHHGMIWISLGLLPGSPSPNGTGESMNRLSSFLGAMSQSPPAASTELAPSPADLETGELLGVRVALAAQRWVHGAKSSPVTATVGS